MKYKNIVFMVCLMGIIASAYGAEENTIHLSDELKIKAYGSSVFKFELEEIPQGKQVRLFMDARIDWVDLGGNRPAMMPFINNKKMMGKMLLNKPLTFTMRGGRRLDWASKKSNSYRLMYSNDFSDKIKTLETYQFGIVEQDQDPYRFVWDITNHIHLGKNSFRINAPVIGIVIRNVVVEIGNKLPQINNQKTILKMAPTGSIPTYQPRPHPQAAKTIEISSKGNIRFNVNGKRFKLLSRTSFPQGQWSNNESYDSWEALARGDSKVVSWKGPGYVVSRKITLKDDHVKVEDTIRNVSEKLVGVIFENNLSLPEEPKKILLAGIERDMKYYESSANPTVMAQLGELAVGLVAEDDIFRTHCKILKNKKTITLADTRLGLAAGESHTLEWSIYMVPQGDYYDFINAIRRNWGSNYTLTGPYLFPENKPYWKWRSENLTVNLLKEWMKRSPAQIVITHVANTPYIPHSKATIDSPVLGHGTGIPRFKVWCDKTRALVEKMHQADPAVKVFSYLHKNMCTEVGYSKKYRDSIAMQGKRKIIPYSVPPRGLFLPTLNNSYGKALEKVYQYLVEYLGANIYLDEISAGVSRYGVYPEWDHCSVFINPKSHSVEYKLSSAHLLMKPWIGRLVQYLRDRGRNMIGNGPFIYRTMLDWHIQTFVENSLGVDGIISMHLGTPLVFTGYALGLPGYNYGKKAMNYGGIPFTRSGPWNNMMFPITPIELRPGVIIAKERILTNRSGSFGWGDSSTATVYVYDGKGNLVENPNVRERSVDGEIVTDVRMASDHIAVLVRLGQLQ